MSTKGRIAKSAKVLREAEREGARLEINETRRVYSLGDLPE